MVERIVFDAVLFCCGDIFRKGVELAFQRSAVPGEDIEQRRQGGITEFSAYRFRRSRIVHIEPNPDTATEKSRYSPFLIAPDLRLADRRALPPPHEQVRTQRHDAITDDRDSDLSRTGRLFARRLRNNNDL